jgi:hypothetical protein
VYSPDTGIAAGSGDAPTRGRRRCSPSRRRDQLIFEIEIENVVPPEKKNGWNIHEETDMSSVSFSNNVSPDNDAEWTNRFLESDLFVKDLPPWCRNHGKGGVHAHDTIRPEIREKIHECQGLYDAAQKLGKTAYLCDSHAKDPSHVRFIFVTHFPVETDDPLRPFRLNARGEFENPSLKAMADLFIGCLIAHGCDPDVAKNLFYSSFGIVDVLPVMGPHDLHSKKATYIAPNDYDTAMSQMAEASSEMLEALPSIFPNFKGYFLFGEAHHFFQTYMGKSKHSVLNTEKVVHPTSIACKWWDTDQQLVAVRQACIALSAATGLDFHHSNIEKRKSEERLDAAIRREDEEMQVEQDRQLKKEQEEHARQQARQQKKEQEEQAPKARGKYKTFNDKMEDLKRFEETHGHANVTIREDIPLGRFCAQVMGSGLVLLRPQTKKIHPHNMATAFAHVKDGVSVLMDAFKQYANKNIFECAKDGFPGSFLLCMNPQAAHRPSMTMSLSQSQGGTTCKPQISWVRFLFPHHMESTQLYESQSFSIMLQMMNLTRKAIPHCIFSVTYPGNSTMPQ